MLDLLASLLTTPEAQADPHYWGAVLLAHALIGMASAAVAAAFFRDAAIGVVCAILLWAEWETAQFLLFGASGGDCIVDLAANAVGAIAAWALWQRKIRLALAALLIPLAFAARRLWRRP